MKLNIFTGLLLALLFTIGVNTNAGAHGWGCCRWHHHHHGCCTHACSKENKDEAKDEKKCCDKGKESCHTGCGWGTCHSWEYVAPKHVEKCCHKESSCHHESNCHHECHH